MCCPERVCLGEGGGGSWLSTAQLFVSTAWVRAGLSQGAVYQIRICASNELGPGPWSPWSSPVSASLGPVAVSLTRWVVIGVGSAFVLLFIALKVRGSDVLSRRCG